MQLILRLATHLRVHKKAFKTALIIHGGGVQDELLEELEQARMDLEQGVYII